MNTISVTDLANRRDDEVSRIDVRSTTEFASGHIPGAISVPLDEIEKRVADLSVDRPLVLICQMGQRARIAADLLRPCRSNLFVLEGGTRAWKEAKLPIVASVKARWSLERQTRFGAGLLVLLSTILAVTVSPYWLLLTGIVGAGLTFAGSTDICLMGMLLAKLPWNRSSHCPIATPKTAQQEAQ